MKKAVIIFKKVGGIPWALKIRLPNNDCIVEPGIWRWVFHDFSHMNFDGEWANAGTIFDPSAGQRNARGLWPLNRWDELMNSIWNLLSQVQSGLLGACACRCFDWKIEKSIFSWWESGSELHVLLYGFFSYYQCIPRFLEKNRAIFLPEFQIHLFSM